MGLSIIKHDKPAKFFGYFPDVYSAFRDWMSQNQSQLEGGLVSENRTTDNPPTIHGV